MPSPTSLFPGCLYSKSSLWWGWSGIFCWNRFSLNMQLSFMSCQKNWNRSAGCSTAHPGGCCRAGMGDLSQALFPGTAHRDPGFWGQAAAPCPQVGQGNVRAPRCPWESQRHCSALLSRQGDGRWWQAQGSQTQPVAVWKLDKWGKGELHLPAPALELLPCWPPPRTCGFPNGDFLYVMFSSHFREPHRNATSEFRLVWVFLQDTREGYTHDYFCLALVQFCQGLWAKAGVIQFTPACWICTTESPSAPLTAGSCGNFLSEIVLVTV